jgi:hypothetical protein
MSLVSGQIRLHEKHVTDRRRARLHVESMWGDASARKYLDVIDELDQADRGYGQSLAALDATFDQADKLLGPIP